MKYTIYLLIENLFMSLKIMLVLLFSEGMKLVKMGNDAIDRVEKKIKVLMMEGEEDVEG